MLQTSRISNFKLEEKQSDSKGKCRVVDMKQCNTSNVKMHSKINSQDLGINHTVQLTSWSGKAGKSEEKRGKALVSRER